MRLCDLFRVARATLAATALALSAGCAADQDFAFTMESVMTVDDTLNLSFTTQQVVDPRTTWSKFGSITGDLTALSIDPGSTVTIARDSGDSGKTLNARLLVGAAGDTTLDTLWSAPNFVIDSSINTPFPIVLDDAATGRLADRFRQSPNTAVLYFSATTNRAPTGFKVVVRLPLRGTYSRGF